MEGRGQRRQWLISQTLGGGGNLPQRTPLSHFGMEIENEEGEEVVGN